MQEKIFYPRVKSQISLSCVQEKFYLKYPVPIHGWNTSDIIVMLKPCWGREEWLLYIICLSDVLWLLVCRGLVCSVWLWYSSSYSLFGWIGYTFCNLEGLGFFKDFELITRHLFIDLNLYPPLAALVVCYYLFKTVWTQLRPNIT